MKALYDRLRTEPDAEGFSVLADALIDRGDPRGELAQLLVGRGVIHSSRLPPEADALLQRHPELLGWFAQWPRSLQHDLRWENGYWYGIRNTWGRQHRRFWDHVLGHESARFLRFLMVRWTAPEQLVEVLCAHRPPLFELRWLQDRLDADPEVDITPLFEALPLLRTVEIWGRARFDHWGWRAEELAVNGAWSPGLAADLRAAADRGELSNVVRLEVRAETRSSVDLVAWLEDVAPRMPSLRELKLSGDVDPPLRAAVDTVLARALEPSEAVT